MAEYINYFWDILAVVMIVSSIVSCFRKGFMYSFVKTVGSIASLIFAAILSQPVSRSIYDTLLRRRMIEGFQRFFESAGEIDLTEFTLAVSEKLSSLPGRLGDQMLNAFTEYADRWYQSFSTADFASYAETFTNAVAEPVVVGVLRCVLFLVMFLLFAFLAKLLANLFKGIKYIPILGSLNAVLGSLLGLILGVIHVLILCGLIWLILNFIGGIPNFLTPEILENTYVMGFIYHLVPSLGGVLTQI